MLDYVSFADKKVHTAFLNHEVSWFDCQLCQLCQTRKKVVLFRGYLPCDILFIGEAPGEGEDAIGYPFIGEAGKYFDKLLNSALMAPYEDCPPECSLCGRTVYSNQCSACGCPCALCKIGITNIVACIPIQPDEEALGSGSIRPPTKDEAAACRPRLAQLIEIAKPKMVICLGNIAERYYAKLKLQIPLRTFLHPAAILRNEALSSQSLQEKRWLLNMGDALKALKELKDA
jgi:uracil-DNA glycosylase